MTENTSLQIPDKNSNRIKYIDCIKGICILIVIYTHILGDFFDELKILFCFHMPIFFALSGLFFKTYNNSFKEFLRKKINTLLVPFVFFYALSYIIYFIKKSLFGSVQSFQILDFVFGQQMFNIPLWFLLSLFIMNIILYPIMRFVASKYLRLLLVICLGIIGYLSNGGKNYFFLMSTFTCLPFFYFGIILKSVGFLIMRDVRKNRFIEMALGCLALTIGIVLAYISPTPPRLLYFNNTIVSGSACEIYLCSLSLVLGLLVIFKYILKGSFLSYIGENSIVLLVLHMLVAPFVYPVVGKFVQGDYMYVVSFIIIVAFSIAMVPLFNRYTPVIIGKKELFPSSKTKKE